MSSDKREASLQLRHVRSKIRPDSGSRDWMHDTKCERMQSQAANVKSVKLANQQLHTVRGDVGSLQSTRVHAAFGCGVDLTEKLKDTTCSYAAAPNHTLLSLFFLLVDQMNRSFIFSDAPVGQSTLCHQIYPGPDLSARLVSRMKT